MKTKKGVLKRISNPTKDFFNEGDIVLIYVDSCAHHYYSIRGGIVLDPFSQKGGKEALEMRVLQAKVRKDPELYPDKPPRLPFNQKYFYSNIRYAEKFANLDDLNEHISRIR